MNIIIVMDTGCQIIACYQMHRAIAICGRILSYPDKFKQDFNIRFSIKNCFFHTITTFLKLLYHNKTKTANLLYQKCGSYLAEKERFSRILRGKIRRTSKT